MSDFKPAVIQAAEAKGIYILMKNGVNAYCPKHAPVPVGQDPVSGNFKMHRMTCDTGCPFANVGKNPGGDDTGFFYEITCEGGTKQFDVELVQPNNVRPMASPIIKN